MKEVKEMKEMKKVKQSPFLTGIRPVLVRLGEKLSREFDYYSILAMDNYGRRYSVSNSGTYAGVDDIYTNRGIVVRVKNESGYAEYSTGYIDEKDVDRIAGELRSKTGTVIGKLPDGCGITEREAIAEEELRFEKSGEYLIHPDELGDQGMIERIERIRQKGLASDSAVLDCIAGTGYQEVHKLFLSKKRDLTQNFIWTNGYVALLAKKGAEVKDSYKAFSGTGGAEITERMEESIPKVLETVKMLLDSEPMVPGTYDCICTPEVTGMIVHEAFGHGVEMDMFVKDRAQAVNFIGKQIASPLVTMHDGAVAAAETGSYFFDDEGTEASDTVVIEKGILKRGICDMLSAMALGTKPTGNGRRQDFGHKVYTRMTNTFFEGGDDSVEDMIASVEYGFLLENPTSGMEDPKNWGIQCMVSHAREIRNGKFTGKVFSPIVLTGYVPDLLKSISMVSPTPELSGSGMCGKGYKEWVKVSDGGPYIKAKIRLG